MFSTTAAKTFKGGIQQSCKNSVSTGTDVFAK